MILLSLRWRRSNFSKNSVNFITVHCVVLEEIVEKDMTVAFYNINYLKKCFQKFSFFPFPHPTVCATSSKFQSSSTSQLSSYLCDGKIKCFRHLKFFFFSLRKASKKALSANQKKKKPRYYHLHLLRPSGSKACLSQSNHDLH